MTAVILELYHKKGFKVLISFMYHWIVLYSGMEMQWARGLFPLLSKLWTIATDVV